MSILKRNLKFNKITENEKTGRGDIEFCDYYTYDVDYVNTHTLTECLTNLRIDAPEYYENKTNVSKLRMLKLALMITEEVTKFGELKKLNPDFKRFTNDEINKIIE